MKNDGVRTYARYKQSGETSTSLQMYAVQWHRCHLNIISVLA